jgi:hypothetical protein
MATLVPFAAVHDGLLLAIRTTPKASSNRIIGVIDDGHGGCALKVAVTAAPEDGRANAAVVRLLARELGLKPREFAIVQGEAKRSKVVALTGDPNSLAARMMERLRPWLTRD